MIRAIILAVRAIAAWPSAPVADVITTVVRAVDAETPDVPAEIIVAIAQHESDFHHNAVSYRRRGRRVDLLWVDQPLPSHVVCGYLQAMATPSTCTAMIDEDGGMRAGVAELAVWARRCAGRIRCMLGGHAAGNVGASRPSVSPFPALFMLAARELGWQEPR